MDGLRNSRVRDGCVWDIHVQGGSGAQKGVAERWEKDKTPQGQKSLGQNPLGIVLHPAEGWVCNTLGKGLQARREKKQNWVDRL